MPSVAGKKPKKMRSLTAEVLKNRMDKTVVVAVKKTLVHPVFKKVVRRTTKLKVHDEKNECGVGDRVRIVQTRPISKEKHWRVAEIVRRSGIAALNAGESPSEPENAG